MQSIHDVTFERALEYFGNSVDAFLIADQNTNTYRALVRRGIFQELLSEDGLYSDLVQTLWFHFNNSDKPVAEGYQMFIPNLGKFVGKYSKRLKLMVQGVPHIVQMMIVPVADSGRYLFLLDELDGRENDTETQKKVSSIQNIYLFTMCFDLVRDTTSSLSLTEVSDETLNYQLSYTAWRDMISNMILPDDKELFLERSDPAYLRSHFVPGHLESVDLQMQNLEGVYIWVKLIFRRMDTTNENDYRFVYMVQNIHEATVSMQATLRHYEELAFRDPMTKVFNHGRLEAELNNAIEAFNRDGAAVSLLILDVDHFKSVNDRFGHAVGDTTLIHFAELVDRALLERNAVFGRWGGEEFAAVIYDMEAAELQRTAEMIRRQVAEEPFETVGSITCSIGCSVLQQEDTAETWFERTDQAVYEAKAAGRNCVRFA